MPLPNGQQYNEAIQHPNICFTDTVLRGGTIEKLPPFNIMPKPYSGGFTSTYKVITANGNWAVRCFTKDIGELQRRYQAYSNFFTTNHSRYFVEADCLTNGILVNGNRFPVIKMKWLEGKALNSFIETNLNNATVLSNILTQFKNLVLELERLGVAHGDLQHGNILVKNNELFLIDYDDMFLPTLQGLTSNGVGHVSYQHPQRTGNNYDKTIDRFSSIVIFLALKSIIAKPLLWNRFTNDDNILFKQEDFRNFNASQLLSEISLINNDFSVLVNRFKQLCNSTTASLPTLQNFIDGRLSLQATTTTAQTRNQYVILDGRQRAVLLQSLGQRVEVICKISEIFSGRASNQQPFYFLNVGSYRLNSISFTVVLWSGGLAALRANNMEPNFFQNRWIKITGVLSSYQNRPNITLDNPRQIEFFESEQEALNRLNNRTTAVVNPPVIPRVQPRTTTTLNNPSQRSRPNVPTSIDSPFRNLSTSRNKPTTTLTRTTSTTSYTTPKKQTSSTSNTGCSLVIAIAVIGGVIGTVISQSPIGFLAGGGLAMYIGNLFLKS